MARRGAGLLIVYLESSEQSTLGAYAFGAMGAEVLSLASTLETCALDELRRVLSSSNLYTWPIKEPAGTPKPAGQLESWMEG